MEQEAKEESNLLLDVGTPNGSGPSGSGTWTTKLRGILALFSATFLITGSLISVQALNNAIPDFQLNTMRSSTAWVFIRLFIHNATFNV